MPHRYFTNDISGGTARLTGAEAAHLAKVMRAKPGQTVIICNGEGTDFEAEIISAAADEVIFKIVSSATSTAEPNVNVHVFMGYAKGERTELAMQKAVELGAAGITPFFSENTVVKPKNEEEKNKRYRRIVLDAAKQSGRGIIPDVGMPLSFAEMLEKAKEYDTAMFFYEGGGLAVADALQSCKSPKTIAVITGAEGGFTPAEAEAAKTAGCICTGLGPRILRCETAPIAALAAIMALTGNLG